MAEVEKKAKWQIQQRASKVKQINKRKTGH